MMYAPLLFATQFRRRRKLVETGNIIFLGCGAELIGACVAQRGEILFVKVKSEHSPYKARETSKQRC